MKRNGLLLLLIHLILLSLVFVLSSCGGEEELPSETEALQETYYLAENGKTEFAVIRSDNSSSALTTAAVNLRRSIIDTTGAEPVISTDWDKNPVYEHEIIVGITARGNTDDAKEFGENGYCVKEENGKIYIYGGSDKGTCAGIDFFVSEYLTARDVLIDCGFCYTKKQDYDIPALYIGNRLLSSQDVISVDSDSRALKSAAELLQEGIYKKTGIWCEITVGDNGAFVLSQTGGSDVNEIVCEGDALRFSAEKIGSLVETYLKLYFDDSTVGSYRFPTDYIYRAPTAEITVRYPTDN